MSSAASDGSTSTNYGYDTVGQLMSLTLHQASSPDSLTQYSYNAQGDRTQQTVNGQTTDYVLDMNAALTQVLSETTGSQTTTYLNGLEVLGQQTNGQWSFNSYDGLGSLRQVTDANGALQYAADYDPYGALLEQYGTA